MGRSTQIRAAARSDRRELIRLQQLLIVDEDGAPAVAEMLASRDGLFVFDRGGGALGGFIHVGTRPYAEGAESSPVGFIEEWIVERDLRRSGVGRRLMVAAEQWVRAHGMTELGSDTWLHNRLSVKAHEGLGFAVAEKLVCFIKPLGPARRRKSR